MLTSISSSFTQAGASQVGSAMKGSDSGDQTALLGTAASGAPPEASGFHCATSPLPSSRRNSAAAGMKPSTVSLTQALSGCALAGWVARHGA